MPIHCLRMCTITVTMIFLTTVCASAPTSERAWGSTTELYGPSPTNEHQRPKESLGQHNARDTTLQNLNNSNDGTSTELPQGDKNTLEWLFNTKQCSHAFAFLRTLQSDHEIENNFINPFCLWTLQELKQVPSLFHTSPMYQLALWKAALAEDNSEVIKTSKHYFKNNNLQDESQKMILKNLFSITERQQLTKTTSIGIVLPLTGAFATYGKSALESLRFGLQALETQGVEIYVEDSLSTVEGALAGITKLDTQKRVALVIGDIQVDAQNTLRDYAQKNALPLINLARAEESLPKVALTWVFQAAYRYRQQFSTLLNSILKDGAIKRIAVLYPNHVMGQEMTQIFIEEATQRDIAITALVEYHADGTNFASTAKALLDGSGERALYGCATIKKKNNQEKDSLKKESIPTVCQKNHALKQEVDFEALFIPDHAKTISYLIPSLVAADMLITKNASEISAYRATTGNSSMKPVLLLGSHLLGDPTMLKRLDSSIDGARFVTSIDIGWNNTGLSPWIEHFMTKWKRQPSALDLTAVAVGNLVSSVMKKSPTTRSAIRRELTTIQTNTELWGTVQFGLDQLLDIPSVIATIKHGVISSEATDSQPQ